jgi:hypothetical protein
MINSEECYQSGCKTGKGGGVEGMEGKLNGNHARRYILERQKEIWKLGLKNILEI